MYSNGESAKSVSNRCVQQRTSSSRAAFHSSAPDHLDHPPVIWGPAGAAGKSVEAQSPRKAPKFARVVGA